jgi:hypothetical protein
LLQAVSSHPGTDREIGGWRRPAVFQNEPRHASGFDIRDLRGCLEAHAGAHRCIEQQIGQCDALDGDSAGAGTIANVENRPAIARQAPTHRLILAPRAST